MNERSNVKTMRIGKRGAASGPEGSTASAGTHAAGITWARSRDADLYRLVMDQRRPLILFARSAACTLDAADDLHEAADELYRVTGMDVRALIPHSDVLEDMLITEGSQGDDPREFRSRYMLYREPVQPLMVCVSTARGTGVEPFHLVDLVGTIAYAIPRPAGIFASRTDRYSTNPEAISQFREAISRACSADDIWVGDGTTGRWPLRDIPA